MIDRTKRLRALGNAVVPQCAEYIGMILMDLETSPNIPKPNALQRKE